MRHRACGAGAGVWHLSVLGGGERLAAVRHEVGHDKLVDGRVDEQHLPQGGRALTLHADGVGGATPCTSIFFAVKASMYAELSADSRVGARSQ